MYSRLMELFSAQPTSPAEIVDDMESDDEEVAAMLSEDILLTAAAHLDASSGFLSYAEAQRAPAREGEVRSGGEGGCTSESRGDNFRVAGGGAHLQVVEQS